MNAAAFIRRNTVHVFRGKFLSIFTTLRHIKMTPRKLSNGLLQTWMTIKGSRMLINEFHVGRVKFLFLAKNRELYENREKMERRCRFTHMSTWYGGLEG